MMLYGIACMRGVEAHIVLYIYLTEHLEHWEHYFKINGLIVPFRKTILEHWEHYFVFNDLCKSLTANNITGIDRIVSRAANSHKFTTTMDV